MCGIVAYTGQRQAAAILLQALARLEYRGYDSAGIAVETGGRITTRKLAGRVTALGTLLTDAPVSGSAAKNRTSGRRALTALPIPVRSPPPP